MFTELITVSDVKSECKKSLASVTNLEYLD